MRKPSGSRRTIQVEESTGTLDAAEGSNDRREESDATETPLTAGPVSSPKWGVSSGAK